MTQDSDAKTPPPLFLDAVAAYDRMTEAEVRETEAYTLGVQSVLWGLQWVKANVALRHLAESLPEGTERNPLDPMPHAYNVFGHARAALNHEVHLVERPNTETPYSLAVVDLNEGPVVVVHPDHGDRYFRTSVWDIWGDARYISQKHDGSHPKPYVLAPLDWEGEVPEGLGLIKFRCRLALLAAHIGLIAAPEKDMPEVRALQDGYKFIALEDWEQSNKELAPRSTGVRPLIRPNTSTPPELYFFEMLCETLNDITLADDEVAFARQAERIGITLEDGLQYNQLDEATIAGLKRAVLDGQSIIEHKARTLASPQPGGSWQVIYDFLSKDYWLFRAAVGWRFVWGGDKSEVLFPEIEVDQHGKPFSGNHQYELQFLKGQLPPSNYWRITMYDVDGWLVDNPIKRYGIGNMAGDQPNLNDDGSLTLYIQHKSPGKDKEANWLPAPEGEFNMMMRMYQPEEEMYQGKFILPPVIKQ